MSLFDSAKLWELGNYETGGEVKGQFHAEDLKRNVDPNWSETYSVGQQNPIHQFIRGSADMVSFKGRFFADWLTDSVTSQIDKLISWAKIDKELRRPPILYFWHGDGHVRLRKCIIWSLSNIEYGEPRWDGSPRHVVFDITLKEYVPFTLEEKPTGESRYHHSKFGDYFELICYREYAEPLIGDVIRRRHYTTPQLQVGDIVKLPSSSTLLNESIEPKSIQLKTAFKPKESPQRTNRIDIFNKRNIVYTSNVIKA